jgi:diguanylate cyclase (GGDEF)-like protein
MESTGRPLYSRAVSAPSDASWSKSWARALERLTRPETWHFPAPSPEEEKAFREDQRVSLLEWGRNFIVFMVLLNVLCWPLDFVLYRDNGLRDTVQVMRLFGTMVAVIEWSLTAVLAAGLAILLFFCGFEMGGLGGPGTFWFYVLPYVVLATVALSFGARVRAAVTYLLAVALLAGYFGLHPEHLRDRWAAPDISFTAVVALFSTVAGILVERTRRQNFFLRRATERQAGELGELLQRVRDLAATDPITSLRNVREFNEQLALSCAQASRSGAALSLIMFDLDHFKSINDRFGHDAGDMALAYAGRVIRRCIRSADVPYRIGGEEFAVICPLASASSAAGVAERIRLALAEQPLPTGGTDERLTASFGVADFFLGEEARELYRRADQALYRAKRRGRNRVETEEGGGLGVDSTPPPARDPDDAPVESNSTRDS